MAGTPKSMMLYDNDCFACSILAKLVGVWSRSGIKVVGHYSQEGMLVKAKFFREYDGQPEDMFWLVRGDTCYGGRSGIFPLVTEIVRSFFSWSRSRIKVVGRYSQEGVLVKALSCRTPVRIWKRIAMTLLRGRVVEN